MAAALAIVLAGAVLIWRIFRALAGSFRAAYERDVDRALARQPSSAPTVTDDELEHLPAHDRYQLSADGRSARLVMWSTPIQDHRRFGNVRLASALRLRS